MTLRLNPNWAKGQMETHVNGGYVGHLEHQMVVRALIAAIADAFQRGQSVAKGEMSVSDAATVVAGTAVLSDLDEAAAKEIRRLIESGQE